MTFTETPALRNEHVILEPLHPRHRDDLADAVVPGQLWHVWYTHVPSPDEMGDEIERRLALQRDGRMAPWAVVDPASGRAVGMTAFCHPDPDNRRLEIGHTWLGQRVHGTAINTSAKLALLTRAFEDLGCIAVEFRTHWHNRRSRAAIERLGAKQDGVLRKHRVMPNGTLRDTVVYSILDDEWPAVKAGLAHRLVR